MALNFFTPTIDTDFVQRTADSRRITRTLVGDFTFDRFGGHHRDKVFLPRNMTKVLAFHDRNRTRGIETGTFRSSSSRTRGPILGNGAVPGKLDAEGQLASASTKQLASPLTSSDVAKDQEPVNGKPDIETMSQQCLKVKAQTGSAQDQNREQRRSIRHQLARQHEDKNAQLYFDLINIRKKLNFKDSVLDEDQRPRKRVRRESITCHCHITIWDNREGLDQKEPIVRKSELCEVSTSDLGVAGFVADIKLQKPFIFKSSDLKVPLETSRETVLGIGDKYFLEIKIIPTKTDVEWPPVPVLGRSEGDQTTGLGRMAAEKLQGALVVRYLHLPQAPGSDVPLSVFFLHEGRTYRSKYGLEVNAAWTKGEMPAVVMKREEEPQLDLWALDEEGRSFGRKETARSGDDQSKPGTRTRGKHNPYASSPVKVIFNIDAASAKGAKDFRKCTMTGLGCPACPTQSFGGLEELQFHFMNSHAKYKFVLEKEEHHPMTNDLTTVAFKIVAVGNTKPRNQEREQHKNEKDLNWQAPPEPLNVVAYVNGDQNWVEQNWAEGPKKPDPPTTSIAVATDTLSTIRSQQYGGFAPAQKGGFLPAEHVESFRESVHTKYPNVKLKTMTSDREIMYTSVSHRQVLTNEDPRSESDDEVEDGWFVEKSLEALDIAAEKQEWKMEERLLRRKWNQARLREKLSNPRYLSDCLIRFVRAEEAWLRDGALERKAAFATFIDELLQRRVINSEVTRDIWMILNKDESTVRISDEATRSDTTINTKLKEQKVLDLPPLSISTKREQQAEAMLQLSPYTCVICTKAIEELRRHGVRCAEHECEAPGVWYHTKCARCKKKDRLGWKCSLCAERISEVAKSKGKETAIE